VLSFLPLLPLWHGGRFMFALSLLFFGAQFDTLAFHLIIFRLTGYKEVAEDFQKMANDYRKAQANVADAAATVASAAKEAPLPLDLLAHRRSILRVMADDCDKVYKKGGAVSAQDVNMLVQVHRPIIEEYLAEKEESRALLSKATSYQHIIKPKSMLKNVKELYASFAVAVAGSSFQIAGLATLAKVAADLLKDDVKRLLGPVLDEEAEEAIKKEGDVGEYVLKVLDGPVSNIANLAWISMPVALYYMYKQSTKLAVLFSLCFYAARMLEVYVIRMINHWTRF
ncbi:unnamed protein product, partial [Chrysoparadoxa australica]